MSQISTHLMFDGVAQQAMEFYVNLFPHSEITELKLYEEGVLTGKVQRARFYLADQAFVCIDTPVKNEYTFSPSTSIYFECESEEEINRLFSILSEGGEVYKALANHGLSEKYAWFSDRFGVAWQLTYN
ncbi:VOC family protein [Paraferrimonas sp. SM1919]|uniref:VOC family protein n=1 Tax=Paraferrimonas sp. SM1919 TaxID=2662263 RepID=UPI0013D27181|nr:VOC family protein [Paraferrimonas sp. SM1919]